MPGAYVNYTLPNCAPPLNQCEYVHACQSSADKACFVFPPRSQRATRLPPVAISQSVCDDLGYLSLNGVYLVGPANKASCGGGNPNVFLEMLADYVRGSVGGVVGVYIFVALILAFMFFATLVLASRRVWFLRRGGKLGDSGESRAGGLPPSFVELRGA